MIVNRKVHICDACGHAMPGSARDDNRPSTLAGMIDSVTNQGTMGTVEVPLEDGETFETRPWYAHRPACLRKAIENVIEGIRPPEHKATERDHDQ